MLSATVPWDVDQHCWADVVDRGTQRLYSPYARDLGLGKSPALVMIDLYSLVFAGGALDPVDLRETHPSSCGKYAHAALEPIKSLLRAARAMQLPVIHVTVNRREDIEATNRKLSDAPDDVWEFHPVCAPLPGELVIRKERASAFYGTSLVAELVRRGQDSVLIAGETTSGCVRASVVDAYSNGFHAAVVEDAVFDRSWLSHCVSLFDLHHKYADVLRTPTALQLLERVAGEGAKRRR